MTRRMLALATLGLLGFVTLGMVLCLAGCGTDRQVAPSTPALDGGDGQWAQVAARPETNPSDLSGRGYGWGTGDLLQRFIISVPIDGAIGGVVKLGGTTLTFSPGAFEGTRTITMVCVNAGGLACQLYPEGLKFSQPVALTMNLTGTPIDGRGATIFWWDPMAGSWVDMMGTYNPKGHTVTTNLEHFSLYCAGRGGRAGW